MGLMDAFDKEDRISMKYSDVYRLLKTAAKAEVISDIAIVETNPAKAGSIIRKLVLKFENSANNTSPNIEPVDEQKGEEL